MSKQHDEDLKSAITGIKSSPQVPVESNKTEPKKSVKDSLEDQIKAAFENAKDSRGVLVESTQKGTYPAGRRRSIGEVFYVKELEAFSKYWMKLV